MLLRRLTIAALFTLFPAWINAQTSEDVVSKAEAAYTAKRYAESANLLLQALATANDRDRANLEYDAACSFALAGAPDKAFHYLDQSVSHGDLDADHMRSDPDLVSLHSDSRWQTILARIDTLSSIEKRRWDTPALNVPYSPDLTDAQKIAGLSHLWAEARYGFANFWHVPDLDWDAAYLDFIPQVRATTSTLDYYRVLTRFYALLQDGHTNVYYPDPIFPGRLPVDTRLVDGHVLLVSSRDPKFNLQGVRIGDEILSINAQPVIAYADQNVRPYVSASSPQDLLWRTYDLFLLSGAVGSTLTLETRSASGLRSTHTFVIPRWASSNAPAFALTRLPGNIAYVALNSFSDNSASVEFDKHFDEIRGAHSLILDLRENGGGSDGIGWHILSSLLDRPVSLPKQVSPRYVATSRAWGISQAPEVYPSGSISPDPKHHFDGPVILLTSARTYSAAEDFAVLFAQSHRGRIIGEATGGSTGQPLSFKLPGGGSGRLCTKHDSFADGTEFVGIGVQPDIPVQLTIEDIRSSRDSVLNAAIALLRTQ